MTWRRSVSSRRGKRSFALAGAAKALGYAQKNAVLTLVERGGSARAFHLDGTAAQNLLPIMRAHLKPGTAIMTEEAGQYLALRHDFRAHEVGKHVKREYVRGAAHTNTVEGFYGVFKRGMKGVYQHCAEKRLRRYVAEFDFRYNNGSKLDVEDAARVVRALQGIAGKQLLYKQPVS